MNYFKLLGMAAMACVASAQTVQFQVTGNAGPIPVSGPLVTQPALMTPVDRAAFAAKQNALGLSNKLPWSFVGSVPAFLTLQTLPPYPVVPTKVSAFQNDALYLTATTLAPLLPLPIAGPQGLIGVTGPVGPAGQSIIGPVGPIGPQGPQGIPGPLNFTGTWNAATVYVVGNMVACNRSSYISLTDANTGNQPDTDLAANAGNWALVAQAGDPGPAGPSVTGATGPEGIAGSIGPMGPQGPSGVQGPQGLTGATGPQGPPGSTLDRRINVLAFGCKANDLTDDLPCFNNAISAAKTMNLYTGVYSGSTLYPPSGTYKLSRHLVLPRNGVLPGSATAGVVNIVCEDKSTTILDFSSDTTDLEGITWDQTPQRTTNQVIENCTVIAPSTPGSIGIHYAYTATNRAGCGGVGPISGVACYNERMENARFENLYFIGNSNTNRASVYLEGDCLGCSYKNWSQRVTQPNGIYNTVLLLADTCAFPGIEQTEACGPNLSVLENLSAGTTGGGGASVFQGRMGASHFTTAFGDGVFGNSQNPYGYAFYNSAGNFLQGLFSEGNGGVQFLLNNCHRNRFENWDIGTPIAADAPKDGIQLVNSSENSFTNFGANIYVAQTWAKLAPGFVRLRLTNSHNNQFYNFETIGPFAGEVASDDQLTNYWQWCDATGGTPTANCRQGPMGKIGTSPF